MTKQFANYTVKTQEFQREDIEKLVKIITYTISID